MNSGADYLPSNLQEKLKMKKSLLTIGILLIIDLLLFKNFFMYETPEGKIVPDLDWNTMWKNEVGHVVIVIVITFFLIKEAARLIQICIKK